MRVPAGEPFTVGWQSPADCTELEPRRPRKRPAGANPAPTSTSVTRPNGDERAGTQALCLRLLIRHAAFTIWRVKPPRVVTAWKAAGRRKPLWGGTTTLRHGQETSEALERSRKPIGGESRWGASPLLSAMESKPRKPRRRLLNEWTGVSRLWRATTALRHLQLYHTIDLTHHLARV